MLLAPPVPRPPRSDEGVKNLIREKVYVRVEWRVDSTGRVDPFSMASETRQKKATCRSTCSSTCRHLDQHKDRV